MGHSHTQDWFSLMPESVATTTAHLLMQVEKMRSEQTIYPAQENILNALHLCGPHDVKVVILGQDPYHEPGQAMGLSFSVPAGEKLPPSLRNMYQELEADLGCAAPLTGDLTPWAQQGVLLLNTTLTVEEHKANSHVRLGWKDVTAAVVDACMALPQPIVFLGWGKHAIGLIDKARAKTLPADNLFGASFSDDGPKDNKLCLYSTHPSPLSAKRATATLPSFLGSRPYSQTNTWLEQHGQTPIAWTY